MNSLVLLKSTSAKVPRCFLDFVVCDKERISAVSCIIPGKKQGRARTDRRNFPKNPILSCEGKFRSRKM